MFFLKRSSNFFFIFIIIGLFQVQIFGQCPTPSTNGFIKSPITGFGALGGADKFEVNNTFEIKANTTLSTSTKNTIRYRVGFLSTSTFNVSDFTCNGSNCKSDPNVIIKSLTSFEIIQAPDLNIIFKQPGYYYIIQTYTDAISGIGYYECLRVTIYPRADFTYRLCGCNDVLVSISKNEDNLFYDEIDVYLESSTSSLESSKTTIKKINYGEEIKLPSFSDDPNCSKRNSLSITARVISPSFAEAGKRKIDPIDFTINKTTGVIPEPNFVEELKCNEKNEFELKFKNPIDEIDISYDSGLNWTTLPKSSYLVLISGKVFNIIGITPPPTGELCFRGNSKCGTIPTAIEQRPKVCYTGEIESVQDKFHKDFENRIIDIKLKNKLPPEIASVIVYRDEKTVNENVLVSSTNTYIDDKPTCELLTYRTLTKINGITAIYSKPETYKLSAANLKPVEGESVVSIKSTSYLTSGQIAELSLTFDPENLPGKKFNFYKSSSSGNFIKINSSPVKELNFFPDFTTDPSVLNCYFVKSVDQCGYESPPSKTICTTLLKENGNLIQWTNENVAVNFKNEYEKIEGYFPQKMACSTSECNILETFPFIKNGNILNMDLIDIDPNVHSINIRVAVKLVGSSNQKEIFSNIIEYFFQPKIFIPSIITPNGDSHNDDLKINGFHIKNLIFEIYDRWGAKIETITNLTQKWIPDPNLPEGEYFYKVTATDYSTIPREIIKHGSILLVR